MKYMYKDIFLLGMTYTFKPSFRVASFFVLYIKKVGFAFENIQGKKRYIKRKFTHKTVILRNIETFL